MLRQLPPPGFYPDPNHPDQMKWWDGIAWTTCPPAYAIQPRRQVQGQGVSLANRSKIWYYLMKMGFFCGVLFTPLFVVSALSATTGSSTLSAVVAAFYLIALPCILGALKRFSSWDEMGTLRKFFLGLVTLPSNPLFIIGILIILLSGAAKAAALQAGHPTGQQEMQEDRRRKAEQEAWAWQERQRREQTRHPQGW